MTVQKILFPDVALHVGEDSVRELPRILSESRCQRVFIVADRALKDQVGSIAALLEGFAVEIYAEIGGEPTISGVLSCLERLNDFRADCVVAIGGGSSIDTAKAAAILATNNRLLKELEGIDKFIERPLPLVAVPTTAGTGSEVSPGAVIIDEEEQRKFTIRSRMVAPVAAILDPNMLKTLPANIAAATGMDAFCHNIEYFLAKSANPLSEGLNLQAIRMISANLRDFVADRTRTASGLQMLIASMIGEISFSLLRLSVNHAIAHPLGVHGHIHHGLACGIMLPYSLRFNMEHCLDKLPLVAQAMGARIDGLGKVDAAKAAIEAIEALNADIGIPRDLKGSRIRREDVPIIAEEAIKSPQLQVNPGPVTVQDIEHILYAALN